MIFLIEQSIVYICNLTMTAGESVIFFPANGINGNKLVYCSSFIYAIFILKVLNMENILY